VLSPFHRTGVLTPAAGRLVLSCAISALLAPFILMSPTTASAQEDPSRAFGDTALTGDSDTVTNDKTVDLITSVDFGAGDDLLTNTGTITIGAKATSPVKVTLFSLDALKNSGLIDLRNGHVGDVLTVSGNYRGSDSAHLGLDVGPDGADRLVVESVANGATAITLGGVSAKTAVLTGDKGPVLIQAGAGSKEDAFTIENNEIGLIHYGLVFDAKANTYRLNGVAGRRAYEALKISEGAGPSGGNRPTPGAPTWPPPRRGRRRRWRGRLGPGLWRAAGSRRPGRRGRSGDARRLQQTTYGGQMGADLINAGFDDGRVLVGLTGGYADAQMRFSGVAGQAVKLRVDQCRRLPVP
jgi:hypothetical protein